MSHTPEPWEVTDLRYIRQSNEPRHVVARASKMDGMEANARRIVAAVNACAGIETYALELMTGELSLLNQVTHKLRERPTKKAVQYRKQRDALLAALEGLAGDIHSLIHESSGVAGLHINDDLAPWHELEAGGRFERLTHLPTAIEAIAAAKGGA